MDDASGEKLCGFQINELRKNSWTVGGINVSQMMCLRVRM
jgi:hypothetical protein